MLTIRNMKPGLFHFGFATLIPAALLAAGAVYGGLWVLAAIIFLTAMTSLLDRVIEASVTAGPAEHDQDLSIAIALAHFMLLPLIVWALATAPFSAIEKVGLFFAAGLWFGQVSNANAHELIHRQSKGLHRLGMWTYITLLFGHHSSAHVLVHHRFVGTTDDPNTSRQGESLYRYMVRAWVGSFQKGFQAEAVRLQRIGRASWRNPYVVYVGGAVLCLSISGLLGGWKVLAIYIALCGYAQSQLLMSDYVQHYGLLRTIGPDGKPEPIGAKHSWNSPHWFSSALMLNATRHSDHHTHPNRHYPELGLTPDAPVLPRPLPLMASIALIPPLWRRIMDPQVERWRNA